MKIFINICSYRDPLLYNTIVDAYKTAKWKNNLVFGIVDQSYAWETLDLKSLPFRNQIKYTRIDPLYTRGPCWARHLSQTFYSGEEYYFQVDSHTIFDPYWDEYLIKNLEELKCYHPKPVITQYPAAFEAIDKNIFKLKKVSKCKKTYAMRICDDDNSFNEDFNHIGGNYYVGAITKILDEEKIVHGFLLAGGLIFSEGSLLEEIPYDPYLFFCGEEPSLALRLFTNGYNIFHLPNMPVYHHYGNAYRTPIWADTNTEDAKQMKWFELDNQSRMRLKSIVTGELKGIYGIGNKRTIAQYKKFCGIDYLNRKISNKNKAREGVGVFELDYREKLPFDK